MFVIMRFTAANGIGSGPRPYNAILVRFSRVTGHDYVQSIWQRPFAKRLPCASTHNDNRFVGIHFEPFEVCGQAPWQLSVHANKIIFRNGEDCIDSHSIYVQVDWRLYIGHDTSINCSDTFSRSMMT